MNKTETLAYQWLQDDGYSVSDIIFRPRTSPDFITADGKGWEVKLARRWQVVFTKSQVANLRAHPNVTLLLWGSSHLQDSVSFKDIEVPGHWGKYRFRLMEGEDGALFTLRLPDDLYEALKSLAERQHRSLNAQIVAMLDAGTPSWDGRPWVPGKNPPDDTHQANTTPPDPEHMTESLQHAIEQVREGKTLTHEQVFGPPLDVQNPPENTAPPVDKDKARAFREKWRK